MILTESESLASKLVAKSQGCYQHIICSETISISILLGSKEYR